MLARLAPSAVAAVAAVALAATFACPTPALATPPTRAEVRAMLSGYEDVPSAAQWRALDPETLGVLIAMYRDHTLPPYVRLRCVDAVGHFPTAATRTFLLAVARAPGQSDLFVREALLALHRAFGAHALRDVAPFLEHREPVVREGAAIALGRIGSPAALDALRRELVREADETVRATIRRQLTAPHR